MRRTEYINWMCPPRLALELMGAGEYSVSDFDNFSLTFDPCAHLACATARSTPIKDLATTNCPSQRVRPVGVVGAAGPPSRLPEVDQRRRDLEDQISTWASGWTPSICHTFVGADYKQWMDWCVPYVENL